jgi:hypothetical protein
MRTIFSTAFLGAITCIGAMLSSAPPVQAQAVVYCTGPGVPVGCVVRPAARARVIYCTRPGYPVGCVDRGAPGVGVAPGVPGNRGGPVNRVGRF